MNKLLFYIKFMWYALWENLHKAKSEVKLAVVGASAVGKTYLLIDFIEALEKLGYDLNKRYKSRVLHSTVEDLLAQVEDDGSVNKSAVESCRQENLYSSRFVDPSDKQVQIEFLDIPGEVMVPDSIRMFRAVMTAMMNCHNKIFTVSIFGNPKTGKMAKVVNYGSKGGGNNGPVTDLIGLGGGVDRQQYYKNNGYHLLSTRKVSGASLFKDFLDYDTDSAIKAIIDAWDRMEVDNVLRAQRVSVGKGVFLKEYRKHFFYHYYIFYATDVVVCDKCCTPVEAGDSPKAKDDFQTMMTALRTMTGFEDLPKKNWYLALKGMDAVMVEEPFKKVFDLSGGDINLVYSHFAVVLRQACKYGFLGVGGAGSTDYKNPFSTSANMMKWLTGERGQDANADLVAELEKHYDPTFIGDLFKDDSSYMMSVSTDIISYLRRRMDDFLMVDNLLLNKKNRSLRDEQTLLDDMPQHVFFVATPIDEQFHIHGHDQDNPKAFAGDARDYNHRACFGIIQLAASIMDIHDMTVKSDAASFGNEGSVLVYVNGQNN